MDVIYNTHCDKHIPLRIISSSRFDSMHIIFCISKRLCLSVVDPYRVYVISGFLVLIQVCLTRRTDKHIHPRTQTITIHVLDRVIMYTHLSAPISTSVSLYPYLYLILYIYVSPCSCSNFDLFYCSWHIFLVCSCFDQQQYVTCARLSSITQEKYTLAQVE